MLANKLCLITGGIGAIGFEIAKKFAKEGASIALVDMHSHAKQAIKELDLISGSQIHSYHKCDVSKKQEILNVFESIRDFHSANYLPKILVNNAGVYINKLIQDQDEEDIDQILDVNLKGTILMTQEFVRHLLRNIKHKKCGPLETYASIVNISSLSGKNGCTEESPYSASKAGVEGFTRSMAKELGQYQIRCNAILPGLIRTPMLMRESRKAMVNRLAEMTTLKRLGEPPEVANVCLFLASEMSSYINGSSIDCNGGLAF